MNEMLEKTEVSSSGEKTEWRCKEGVGLVKARAWLAELKPGLFRDGYTAEFYEVKSREVRVRKPLCSSFFNVQQAQVLYSRASVASLSL